MEPSAVPITGSSTEADTQPTGTPTVLTLLLAACVAAGVWGPATADGVSLAEGSGPWFFVFIGSLLFVAAIGAFIATTPSFRGGLVTGAAIALGGYFGFIALFATWSITTFDASPGLGVIGSWGVVAVSVFALITLFPSTSSSRRLAGAIGAVGALAAAGTVVGIMLPTDDFDTFSSRNFEFGAATLQLGWLALLAGVGMPGIVGFLRGTTAGLTIALGGVVAGGVLWLSSLSEGDAISSPVFHPVFPVALGVQLLALFAGSQSAGNETTADGVGPQRTEPVERPASSTTSQQTSLPPAGSKNMPTAMWASDPFGRYKHRWFNGRVWTDKVAAQGIESEDPATYPAPSNESAWHPDPFGRYRNRYFDGSVWTAHVSDGPDSTASDPATYPAPVPPAAEPTAPPMP